VVLGKSFLFSFMLFGFALRHRVGWGRGKEKGEGEEASRTGAIYLGITIMSACTHILTFLFPIRIRLADDMTVCYFAQEIT
jgi:hypothetical protein